jgi:hypothetical protein
MVIIVGNRSAVRIIIYWLVVVCFGLVGRSLHASRLLERCAKDLGGRLLSEGLHVCGTRLPSVATLAMRTSLGLARSIAVTV